MGRSPGAAYLKALADRAEEIAWAKASLEEKFAEATAEANRLVRMRKPGPQPKDRRLI